MHAGNPSNFAQNQAIKLQRVALKAHIELFSMAAILLVSTIIVSSGKTSKMAQFWALLSFYGVLFFPRNQSEEAIVNNDTSA